MEEEGPPQVVTPEGALPTEGLPRSGVNDLLVDSRRAVWLATDGAGAVRWQEGRWTVFRQREGLPSREVETLALDPTGRLWAGTRNGVAVFDGTRFERRSLADLGSSDDAWVRRLLPTAVGLWVDTSGGALLVTPRGLASLPRKFEMQAVAVRDRAAWILSGEGLYLWDGSNCELALPVEATPVDQYGLRDLAVAPDGAVWVATTEGLIRWEGAGREGTLPLAEGSANWWEARMPALPLVEKAPSAERSSHPGVARLQDLGLLSEAAEEDLEEALQEWAEEDADEQMLQELLVAHEGFHVGYKCGVGHFVDLATSLLRRKGLADLELAEDPGSIRLGLLGMSDPIPLTLTDGQRRIDFVVPVFAGMQAAVLGRLNRFLAEEGLGAQFVGRFDGTDNDFVLVPDRAAAEVMPLLEDFEVVEEPAG